MINTIMKCVITPLALDHYKRPFYWSHFFIKAKCLPSTCFFYSLVWYSLPQPPLLITTSHPTTTNHRTIHKPPVLGEEESQLEQEAATLDGKPKYKPPPYHKPPYHKPPTVEDTRFEQEETTLDGKYHKPPYYKPPYHKPPYHKPPTVEDTETTLDGKYHKPPHYKPPYHKPPTAN
ncbi:hypothetical protein O6P43_003220 [Quillaja saponaria]|uniref:Uncharacterized protein n=1 Tax=Quillaja saponaria TaxID=32244 RepID=A0AAD7QE66_QUISA|nr:hypothetical protein O6P43_003220 [Quillaja saponaria]